MTTYTVFSVNNSASIAGQGLTLEQAAHTLLTSDGYEYEIREEDRLFVLWISDGSRNSTRGARNLNSCAAGGFVAASLEALHRRIVEDEWHGYEAQTDETYAILLGLLALDAAGLLTGDRIVAGRGEDREAGRIVRVIDATRVEVAWEQGTRTSCAIADLETV
jgi:hypothetical protein